MNKNANSIIIKGISILSLILGPSILKYLLVGVMFSTNRQRIFIIGRLINPIIASTAAGFEPSDFLGNAFEIPIYAA